MTEDVEHRSYWMYGRAFSSGGHWWFRAGWYAPLVWDGTAVAEVKLFVCDQDGRLTCLGAE